jgi:GntR family transcriptional regulator
MERAGKSHQAQLLEWVLGLPTAVEAKDLALAAKLRVYRLEILRSVEGVPISITTSVLPELAVPELERHLGGFYSLYAILESRYNFRPLRVKTTIHATGAKAKDASFLCMPTEVPMLLTESLMYHPAGYPVECATTRARGDMCHLCIDFGSTGVNERGGEQGEAGRAKLSRQSSDDHKV